MPCPAWDMPAATTSSPRQPSAPRSASGHPFPRFPLRIRVIGTPAEEVGEGSGKILLLERGALDDVDAAIMIHPAPFDVLAPVMIAAARFEVEYQGKESHAAFYPELESTLLMPSWWPRPASD